MHSGNEIIQITPVYLRCKNIEIEWIPLICFVKMEQALIAAVGTKQALPFIEEFGDAKLSKIAKTDLQKASALLFKAQEK